MNRKTSESAVNLIKYETCIGIYQKVEYNRLQAYLTGFISVMCFQPLLYHLANTVAIKFYRFGFKWSVTLKKCEAHTLNGVYSLQYGDIRVVVV